MAEITYEENLEMFRSRNSLDIPNLDETNDISVFERLVSLLKEKKETEGIEYVIAEWTEGSGGPFLPKGHPGPKSYGYELRPKDEVREYRRKIGKEGKYWDPHIGCYWDAKALEYCVDDLRRKSEPKTPLVEAEA